jgi:hypothetical protein
MTEQSRLWGWVCSTCDYATQVGIQADGHEYASRHVMVPTDSPSHPDE